MKLVGSGTKTPTFVTSHLKGRTLDPLHAILEEFAADGYTQVEANCPRCRVIRLWPIDQLPKITLGLTLDGLARRLRCAKCGGPLLSVKPRQMRAAGWGEVFNRVISSGDRLFGPLMHIRSV